MSKSEYKTLDQLEEELQTEGFFEVNEDHMTGVENMEEKTYNIKLLTKNGVWVDLGSIPTTEDGVQILAETFGDCYRYGNKAWVTINYGIYNPDDFAGILVEETKE